MAEFGEKLRIARETIGITQQTLADKLFVTRQCVSRWECGERYPDLLMVQKISKELCVDIAYLMSDEESEKIINNSTTTDNKMLNSISLFLFSGIIVLYSILLITNIFKIFNYETIQKEVSIFILTNNVIYFASNLILLSSTVIFIFRKILTSKKVSWIISIFLLLNNLPYISSLLNLSIFPNYIGVNLYNYFLIFMNILGCISCLIFYYKNNRFFKWMTYLSISINLTKSILSTTFNILFAFKYVGTEMIISLFLHTFIYILFGYFLFKISKIRKTNISIVKT